jgi:serine-type D-Ala-D-Ala carboxypeptidase (penicillin-binding protein 5/6)
MKDFLKLINKISPKRIFTVLFSVLVIIFVILFAFEIYITDEINGLMVKPAPVEKNNLSDYPVLNIRFDPGLSARGAIILDADSKVVLYEKNSNLKFSTASTAKIMTAITALGKFDLNDVLVVKSATDEGSLIGVSEGEKLSFESLLYAMLLPSGNDAAFTIAQNYKGGQEKFVELMNTNAYKWHLQNTHFADPAGLIDEEDYTTPRELAELAGIALDNPIFAKAVSTKDKNFTSVDGIYSYSVSNLNKLLGVNGVNGVKTGFTNGAGQVLVTSKLEPAIPANGEKQHKIIMVVMDSQDRFADTEKLIGLVSGNVNYLSIRP